MDNKKSLILVDGHALAYRMFFALERTGMKTSDNQPTWAVYGFFNALFDLLKKYIAEHGYPPAIREICKGVNLSSPATVFVHMKNLEQLGYIKTTSNKFRTIEILCENEYLETKEDIVKVANSVTINTIYFLKDNGTAKEDN